MNNNDSDFTLQLAVSPIHHDVVSSAAANNLRKKRSKTENPKPPFRNGAVSASPKREKRPEITMPCSECGKRFWSWKALFGHMRCHPERQWRGINPPPNLLRRPIGFPAATTISEDENDVAGSLLLLASGRPRTEIDIDNHDHGGHGGFFRFECSSCNKVFGSRQALGGHRASHKNVKGCFAMATPRIDVEEHKCGICLRNFSSGQALGGHMRCHFEKLGLSDNPTLSGLTAATTTTINQALECSFGGWDLNSPAAVEDHDVSSSPAASTMALDLRLGL